jgi:hypothetical protein
MNVPVRLIIPLTAWLVSHPDADGAAPGATVGERWIANLLAFPYESPAAAQPTNEVLRQDHGQLELNRSVLFQRSDNKVRLDEPRVSAPPWRGAKFPFSFMVGGQRSDELLPSWKSQTGPAVSADGVESGWRTWTDPVSGFRVRIETRRFAGFSALEWILFFENTGAQDSPLIENIQALDLTLDRPLSGEEPYRLHRGKGAPSNPSDFEPATVVLKARQTEILGAGGGRSSNRDFPFFKVEAGNGSLVVAVGWSGQWQATLNSPDGYHLHLTAGMEQTHLSCARLKKCFRRGCWYCLATAIRWRRTRGSASSSIGGTRPGARARPRCPRSSAIPASPAAAAGSTSATPRTRYR